MRRRGLISWLALIGAFVLPLALCSTLRAESGCHRAGGDDGGTEAVRVAAPSR